MKILISVLSLEREPYISLEKTIRETWASEKNENVDIIFYYGNSSSTQLIGDKLYVDVPEGLMNVGSKTIKMFEFINDNFGYDYIFRTNSSSYVNIKKLIDFVSDKPKEKFYCGCIGGFYGINFASGSGYFLSKDVVKIVIDNKHEWDHKLIDDVSLGKLLVSKGYNIYEGLRSDIILSENLPIDLNHYHYRVKHPSNRKDDEKVMWLLHNKLSVL